MRCIISSSSCLLVIFMRTGSLHPDLPSCQLTLRWRAMLWKTLILSQAQVTSATLPGDDACDLQLEDDKDTWTNPLTRDTVTPLRNEGRVNFWTCSIPTQHPSHKSTKSHTSFLYNKASEHPPVPPWSRADRVLTSGWNLGWIDHCGAETGLHCLQLIVTIGALSEGIICFLG